jgi:hypothetical protein
VRFEILFVLVVLAHDRRRMRHFGITAHPTAAWTAQQVIEAFPWETAPRYLLRDYNCVYGVEFCKRVASMGIEEVLIAPRSPWQIAIRRARDRQHPPRVHRQRYRSAPAAPAPHPHVVLRALPSRALLGGEQKLLVFLLLP